MFHGQLMSRQLVGRIDSDRGAFAFLMSKIRFISMIDYRLTLSVDRRYERLIGTVCLHRRDVIHMLLLALLVLASRGMTTRTKLTGICLKP
jgi:hypothetical protein